MPTVNIGILAHVDAGKTSLTERLLYDTGVIEALGSVDAGTTRTDTAAVERRRGITVRAAVAALPVAYGQVNLLDTPGHSEFVAEVERVLDVLDAAVLVVPAVEGVRPRTRVLMGTLRRMRLPALIFVNKLDRPGARYAEVLAEVRRRLTAHAVPMVAVRGAATPGLEVAPYAEADPAFREALEETLADVDEAMLARLVDGPKVGPGELRTALWAQVAAGRVHPVYAGSAITGAGVAALVAGLGALPVAAGAAETEVRATRAEAGAVRSGGGCSRSGRGRPVRTSRTCGWRPVSCGRGGG